MYSVVLLHVDYRHHIKYSLYTCQQHFHSMCHSDMYCTSLAAQFYKSSRSEQLYLQKDGSVQNDCPLFMVHHYVGQDMEKEVSYVLSHVHIMCSYQRHIQRKTSERLTIYVQILPESQDVGSSRGGFAQSVPCSTDALSQLPPGWFGHTAVCSLIFVSTKKKHVAAWEDEVEAEDAP